MVVGLPQDFAVALLIMTWIGVASLLEAFHLLVTDGPWLRHIKISL